MNNIENKKILLIICGGISAYKSLEIIRLLKKQGATVKSILTQSAKKFVTPLSVASLSQEKVYDDLFSHENESEMDHISLSRWSDLILVAPATANTISKLSAGSSDDLASTVILASDKKIFLVPAMNVRMWEHPSTKENLQKLKSFGYQIIGPEIGDMACGEYGQGKMTEPQEIINNIEQHFFSLKKHKKFKALVTAGPTHEYIDPIRFIFLSIFKLVGPDMRVVSNPFFDKDLANSKPCFPLDLLVINLTGSIYSCVGPAVTKALNFLFFSKTAK